MRYVVENDPVTWCEFLGVKVEQPPELLSPVFTAESQTADLLLKVGPERLLHAEYIREPRADMYVRMLGYRARIMREYPGKRLVQYAVLLGPGNLKQHDDPEHGFYLGLRVLSLPQVHPQDFLRRPSLAVLAELAQGDEQTRVHSAAAALRIIQNMGEPQRTRLLEAMFDLATISLSPSSIRSIRKETGMSIESVVAFYEQTDIGQAISTKCEARGLKRGREEGRGQGREEGSAFVLAALLRDRFGMDHRIPELAGRLAQNPDVSMTVHALREAEILDDLIPPPPLGTDAHS